MAKGGDSFGFVRSEEALDRMRLAIVKELGLGEDALQKADGQPFFLRLLAGVLREAGDPDWRFLEEAEVGLPVGVLHPLPRTPEVFERQTKWALEGEDWEDWAWQKDNYSSAEVHAEHLEAHLESEVHHGLVFKMSEAEFERTYGANRAVAALAVLVEDEASGKKRVIHDATHGVKVNQRIRCLDKVRMPGPREKRALLEEYHAEMLIVLSLVGDFAKAHRRFKYREDERGFLACKVRSESDVVYVNQVGTFGVASTPYWWARISAALMRGAYAVLGPQNPVDMLLYADDLEVMGAGGKGRRAAVLAFAIMAIFGAPFKWGKQRGGLVTEWVGITVNYPSYSMGLSKRRASWAIQWIESLRERKQVAFREFAGRLGFAALALPWTKPFLGPLYAWASAIQGNKGEMTIPWAVLFILEWVKEKMKDGMHMEVVEIPRTPADSALIVWTDAKATDERAWIGGWLQESSEVGECRWFSMEVTEEWAPWLKCRGNNPKRVIAALEMLGTLVGIKLWGDKRSDTMRVMAQAFTDNQGNQFIMRKGMSTKFPLTVLMMEMEEELREKGIQAELHWVSREKNQEADDLTNEDFSEFSLEKRCGWGSSGPQWKVLDRLMMQSQRLFEEIAKYKIERSRLKAQG